MTPKNLPVVKFYSPLLLLKRILHDLENAIFAKRMELQSDSAGWDLILCGNFEAALESA